MEERGWTNSQLRDALEERKGILEYMVEKKINNCKEISRIVQRYALDPDAVLSEVRGLKSLIEGGFNRGIALAKPLLGRRGRRMGALHISRGLISCFGCGLSGLYLQM